MYELRKLTAAESASPLAALLDCQVPAADLSPFARPLPAAEAFYPSVPDDILDPTERTPNGWRLLDNGAGYLTVEQDMPGVTLEMLRWMIAWQGLEPLNYCVLDPLHHHSAAVSDVDREKLLSPVVSNEHKSQGVTLFTVEQTGSALHDNITMYLSPEKMGLDCRAYYAGDARVLGGTFIRQDRAEKDPGKKWVGIVAHIVAPTEQGVRVTTRMWVGCRLLRGVVKRLDRVSLQPTAEVLQALAEHTAAQWAALAAALPRAWAAVQEQAD